jgi:hypothetical protein
VRLENELEMRLNSFGTAGEPGCCAGPAAGMAGVGEEEKQNQHNVIVASWHLDAVIYYSI